MRYIMFLLMMLLTGTAQAIDCDVAPTCAELGYTTEEDSYCADNGYMFCPLDHSYKKCVNMDCAKMGFTEDDKTSWCTDIVHCKGNKEMTLCNCLKARCNIGDVFYADGSCGDVKDYTEDKIPVGVVYYTDCSGAGKVISLKNLTLDSNYVFHPTRPFENTVYLLPWGLHGIDVPTLKNYETNLQLLAGFQTKDPELYNGEKDTLNLINAYNNSCTYDKGTKEYAQYCVATAALAAHQFYPLGVEANNTIVGAGRWYLPSLGELTELYGYNSDFSNLYSGRTGETIAKVTQTLTALKSKAEPLSLTLYWASTEKNYDLARELMFGTDASSQNLGSGYISEYHKNDPHCAVRASLNFR